MSDSDAQQISLGLAQAYEVFQKHDQAKDEFVRMMISKIKTLEERLQNQDFELEQKTDLVSYYHKALKQSESELQKQKTKQEQSNFTLVLLDGDIMLFHDKYLEKGMEGGKDAARGLKVAVESYMDEKGTSSRILVQVYANVSGLKKLYDTCDVNGFIQGFNMFDGLYQIIDAGNGKECSDEKVKKLFELFIKDVHCNHIIFGASADNGYARLLEAYAGNERLTLLEGPPFARELASIVRQSQTTQFASVFRSSKKDPVIDQLSQLSLFSPEAAPAQLTILSPASAQPASLTNAVSRTYAALASRPPVAKAQNQTAIETKRSRSPWTENGFPIWQNVHGERVDEKLKAPMKDIEAVKGKKLCNNYHLFDNCLYGNDDCEHRHGPRLSEAELVAQRVLARSTPCFAGSECENPWCTCGHQCHYGFNCNRSQCRFPHISDIKPAQKI